VPALLAINGRLEIWGREDFLPVLRGHASVAATGAFERPGIHLLFSDGAPELPFDLSRALAGFDAVVAGLGSPGGALERSLRAASVRRVVTAPVPARDARGGPRATLRIRAALESAGLALKPHEPLGLEPDSEAIAIADALLSKAGIDPGAPIFLFHPGSGSPRKNWPLKRFLSVARAARDLRGLAPLAITGPADEAERHEIARTDFPVMNAPPVEALLSLLSRASAYAGNDSGVSHLAAAARTSGVVIFGPTDPAVWAPDSARLRIIRAGNRAESVTEGDVLAALGL